MSLQSHRLTNGREGLSSEPCMQPVISKLARLTPLDDEDRDALRAVVTERAWVSENRCLMREGQTLDAVCALLDGWACRCKDFRDGRRQIIALMTPGDLIGLDEVRPPRKSDHSVYALTPAKVAWIPRDLLDDLLRERRRIHVAIRKAAAIEEAILRAWLVNLGQRPAHQRMAFFFCEMAERLAEPAGAGGRDSYALPLTQQALGHALGLTPVHVNRVLRRLRDDGLVEFHDGAVTLRDPEATRRLAGFSGAYLFA